MSRVVFAALVGLLVSSCVPFAFAQEAEEGERPAIGDVPEADVLTTQFPLPAVEDQPSRRTSRDEAGQRGLGSATLRLFPALEIGSLVTSNADRAPGGAKAEFGLRIAPSLRLQSNWSRHELVASGRTAIDYFVDSDNFEFTNSEAAANLRLDIRRSTRVDLNADFIRTRTNNGTFDSGVALTHDFGRLELRGRLGAEVSDEAVAPQASLRGTWVTHGVLRPFAEIQYVPRLRSSPLADSQGGSLSVGVQFDYDPFLAGEIAAVYAIRDFKDGATLSAAGVAGNLSWRPTEFTNIVASSGVEIDDEARVWTAGVDFAHEPADALTLFAGVAAEISDGTGPADVTITSNTGLAWRFNPLASWSLRYENEFAFAGASADDFDEHRVIASIILQP